MGETVQTLIVGEWSESSCIPGVPMRGVFATAAVTSFLIVSLAGGCGRAGAPSAPSSAGSTPAVVRTLVEVTADLVDVTKGYTGTDNWVGQSVTIPGTGSYNNVRFSWYHYNPAGVPTAFGTLLPPPARVPRRARGPQRLDAGIRRAL
jgi:hypothetical protein